jgi:hypothetical protein
MPSAAAHAQPSGHVFLTFDALPNAPVRAVELRARLFAEDTFRPSELMTLHLAGYVDGLVADREGEADDAIARPREAYLEIAGTRADLRLGYTRIVWGRLDEVQPSDVINPIDLATYFFDGRAEARLPVALARGRLFFGERATVEGVLVPDFRRGRFDQLDEPSSPFNLAREDLEKLQIAPLGPAEEPKTSWRNMQGGGRLSFTAGRLDWSATAYRGFRSFAEYEIALLGAESGQGASELLAPGRFTYPRFTMLAGDFETVTGEWAWRGEAAVFSDACDVEPCRPRTFDVGAGFDRRAGSYRVSGSLLVQAQAVAAARQPAGGLLPGFSRTTTTSITGSAERAFARERYRARVFALVNVDDAAAFLRSITTVELRDNVSVEASLGWFVGEGAGIIARYTDRDFVYARLRVFF